MASVTHPVKTVDTDQNIYAQKLKTKVASLQKTVDQSFGNFHANLMNDGKDDAPTGSHLPTNQDAKADRIAAMKRRSAKAY